MQRGARVSRCNFETISIYFHRNKRKHCKLNVSLAFGCSFVLPGLDGNPLFKAFWSRWRSGLGGDGKMLDYLSV